MSVSAAVDGQSLRRVSHALSWRVRAVRTLLAPPVLRVHAAAWLANARNAASYQRLELAELQRTRKSATLFIFGSGPSLNAIPPAEWAWFEQHDTLGFNWFMRQQRVRVDYHLVREVSPSVLDPAVSQRALSEYAAMIEKNPKYARTVLVVQGGWRAIDGNRLIGTRLLPTSLPVFRFTSRGRGGCEMPSTSFDRGLVHGHATLHECVNFGALLGWSRLVLVGVDMRENTSFWLKPGERRDSFGASIGPDRHAHYDPNAAYPNAWRVAECLAQWRPVLERRGVELFVYNPQSLLADVLPVYPRSQGGN